MLEMRAEARRISGPRPDAGFAGGCRREVGKGGFGGEERADRKSVV